MGRYRAGKTVLVLGWAATAVMAIAAVGMIVSEAAAR